MSDSKALDVSGDGGVLKTTLQVQKRMHFVTQYVCIVQLCTHCCVCITGREWQATTIRLLSVCVSCLASVHTVTRCSSHVTIYLAGDVVFAHYTGRLEDGTVFDSTSGKPHRQEHGFYFTLGQNQVTTAKHSYPAENMKASFIFQTVS